MSCHNEGFPVFRWIRSLDDYPIMNFDELPDEKKEWMEDNDGHVRLLIDGFKMSLGCPDATNTQLEQMQDARIRGRDVDEDM
jgi:hypothetical protein